MASQDIKQITVDGNQVGIIGLQEVLEQMAKEYPQAPDHKIQEELLKRLGRKNYIPTKAQDSYAKAFLREFKKFLGLPYEEDKASALDVKVLGPGCTQCDRLTAQVMEAMAEMGIMGNVDHIKDIKEIGKYGVMGSPALLINGQVKCVGSVPPKAKLLKWLEEAKSQIGAKVMEKR